MLNLAQAIFVFNLACKPGCGCVFIIMVLFYGGIIMVLL